MGTALRKMGRWIGQLAACAFFIVWLVLWTAATISGDVDCAKNLMRQTRALIYPNVWGTVDRSQLIKKTSSKGNPYEAVDVSYTYRVDSKTYSSDRESFTGDTESFSKRWAAQHPPGSTVRVFYDPRHPNHAALKPGLSAGDLLFPLFLVFFNIFAYLGVYAFSLSIWNGFKRIIGRRTSLNVRRCGSTRILAAHTPFERLGLVLLAFTACSAALAALGFAAGNGLGARSIALIWLLLFWWAACAVHRRWKWGWTLRGYDLEVDPDRRMIRLPYGLSPGVRHDVPFANVKSVDVVPRAATDVADEDEDRVRSVVLRWRGARGERSTVIQTTSNPARARHIRDWLFEQLGLVSQDQRTP